MAGPSRLAAVRGRLHALGASAEAVRLVQLGHRSSTQSVYASHWARWFAWCVKNKVSPTAPKEVDVANHLAQLASVHSLSASCLRVRRSAINTTLRQLGVPPCFSSSIVADVIKGAAFSQRKSAQRCPRWDVFLVLAFLRESRFEPLAKATLPDLSKKALFLIALASARRVSEVHALSGLSRDVAFLADGGLQLEFLPEFLAKNQSSEDDSPSVLIPSLEEVVCPDDPDRVNCPVRVLRYYRSRTEKFRSSNQRRLFISLNLAYEKDILKPTLARWLVSLVRDAYHWASANNFSGYLPLAKPSAHEVRAWSASLAHANGLPVRQLLAAAYWRHEDVFINHYLRDGAKLLGDGSHGIRSLVAAQAAVSGRRS